MQDDDVIASTNSEAMGSFIFNEVENGTYVITGLYDTPWGGPNATDALWVSQHYSGTRMLTSLNLEAGNVNASASVNNTDALQIVRRYSGFISSFPADDWLFENLSVPVSGCNVTQNLHGIITGDVRGQAGPSVAKVSNVSFLDGEVLKVNPLKKFDLPIQAAEEMNLGAVSLQFNYSTDIVELVSIKAAAENMIYNDVESYVTIAW